MKARVRRIGLGAILLLAILLGWGRPAPAYAAEPGDGKVIFGGTYTLGAGETLPGDLTVFGGTATLLPESQVEGDVAVFGGRVVVAGEVRGDVVVVAGKVTLRPTAVVEGDVVLAGGRVERELGAQVNGQTIGQGWAWRVFFGPWWGSPGVANASGKGWALWFLGFWVRVALALLRALVFALLAVLLVVLLPEPTRKVSATMLAHPWESLGMGVILAVLTPVVMVVLLLTLVGIPLALVLVAAVGLAALYGWLALGVALGEKLTEGFHAAWNPLVSAAVGTALLYLVVAGADLIPCVGWLVGLFTFIVGLGGATLALFDVLPLEVREKMSHTITVQAAPAEDEGE